MRNLPLLSLALWVNCSSAPSTPAPQPGCSVANCRAALEGCFAETSTVTPTCYVVASLPDGGRFDDSAYCVSACNASPGTGASLQCLADHAGACVDGGDRGRDAIFAMCNISDAGVPQKSCNDACLATRDDCDDKCTGGQSCVTCVRAGMTSCPTCVDGGLLACADCSSKCGLAYLSCSQACPQQ
jgi:hypothetical protein